MTGTHTSWTYIFCLKDDGVYHAGAIDNSDLSVIKREEYDKLSQMLHEYHSLSMKDIEGNVQFDISKLHQDIFELFNGELDSDDPEDLFLPIVEMLMQGCMVETHYFYDSYSELYYDLEFERFEAVEKWDQMSDDELEMWLGIINGEDDRGELLL